MTGTHNAAIYTDEDRDQMQLQISYIKAHNTTERRKYEERDRYKHLRKIDTEADEYYQSLNLPRILPLPEYESADNTISTEDNDLDFYLACQNGLVHQIDTVLKSTQPPHQHVRQYGLQVAAFAYQVATVR